MTTQKSKEQKLPSFGHELGDKGQLIRPLLKEGMDFRKYKMLLFAFVKINFFSKILSFMKLVSSN